MSNYEKEAMEIAKLVESKQEAYGDSFGKSAEILKSLYPNGIKVEQYQDVLTLVRIIDKMFRIATKKDAFGESPYKDILGYALLAVAKDSKEKTEKVALPKITAPYPPSYMPSFTIPSIPFNDSGGKWVMNEKGGLVYQHDETPSTECSYIECEYGTGKPKC